MPDHCPHEAKVGSMEATLKRIDKDLYGNGQEGLVKKFTKMETEHNEMKGDLNKLATSFSALAKSDSNREAIRKALGKSIVTAAAILGIAGTIITIINVFT